MSEENAVIPPVLNFWAGMFIVLVVIAVVGGLCWLLV